MQTHELKCLPNYFDAVARGEKTFEVRHEDRGFKVGDVIKLERWSPERGYGSSYEGHGETRRKIPPLEMEITYLLAGGLLQFGIEPGYVVIGIKPLKKEETANG